MSCIYEFREIFQRKSNLCLYLFIEKYKISDLKELSHSASGLEKDLSVVENAVASPLSNGFVVGTNSKLKMIKRTMYGCCINGCLVQFTEISGRHSFVEWPLSDASSRAT